jgi:phenylacetate-CoA ligase
MHGRSIDRKLAILNESQWWPREKLERFQLSKLQQLMRHVYDNVPFYQREMRQRGLRPEDFTTSARLRDLPLVTKAMLMEAPKDFLSRGAAFDTMVRDSTGGSTNEPTTFYRSREQDSWHWAIKYRMWGMAGYRLGLPYVNIYNMKRSGWKKRVQDCLLRNHGYYLFAEADQEQDLARMLRALADPRIHFLAACTTSVRVLADYRASLSNPPPIHLRAILSTGSLLTQRDRDIIETNLRTPMWDHYGLGGEGAHVAAECEYKHGYHVNVENMIVQPADPTKIDTGDATELHITVLDNFEWPLICYVTGDRAVFSTRDCPCGRGLPLFDRIDGRVSEVLALPNGVKLNTHYFSVILAEADAVAQYQIEQTARDRLLVRVIWRDQPDRATQELLAKDLERISNGSVRVAFETVFEIPQLKSGKHRFLIALADDDHA